MLGVGVPWRHQTVDIRSGDATVNLIRCTGVTGWLSPVVIFQFDIKNSADLFPARMQMRRNRLRGSC